MRVDESDRELAKREREFVESFTGKKKRQNSGKPSKKLSRLEFDEISRESMRVAESG